MDVLVTLRLKDLIELVLDTMVFSSDENGEDLSNEALARIAELVAAVPKGSYVTKVELAHRLDDAERFGYTQGFLAGSDAVDETEENHE